jgi:hypothetical protein
MGVKQAEVAPFGAMNGGGARVTLVLRSALVGALVGFLWGALHCAVIGHSGFALLAGAGARAMKGGLAMAIGVLVLGILRKDWVNAGAYSISVFVLVTVVDLPVVSIFPIVAVLVILHSILWRQGRSAQ